jgi:hypothetical protein
MKGSAFAGPLHHRPVMKAAADWGRHEGRHEKNRPVCRPVPRRPPRADPRPLASDRRSRPGGPGAGSRRRAVRPGLPAAGADRRPGRADGAALLEGAAMGALLARRRGPRRGGSPRWHGPGRRAARSQRPGGSGRQGFRAAGQRRRLRRPQRLLSRRPPRRRRAGADGGGGRSHRQPDRRRHHHSGGQIRHRPPPSPRGRPDLRSAAPPPSPLGTPPRPSPWRR